MSETAFCVKCRTKQTMKKCRTIKKKNRYSIKGICTKCGTKMNKFIKSPISGATKKRRNK